MPRDIDLSANAEEILTQDEINQLLSAISEYPPAGFEVPEDKPNIQPLDFFASRVDCCSRCGRMHEDVTFKKLQRPIKDYTYWSTCPVTGEPLLLRIIY